MYTDLLHVLTDTAAGVVCVSEELGNVHVCHLALFSFAFWAVFRSEIFGGKFL
jgi:hypothetical protein